MLLINYRQDGKEARAEVKGKSADFLDMIMALYYIARAFKFTKAEMSALVDAWDKLTEMFKEDNNQ